MADGIQIYELRRMDLRGATVIDGFPSVGLVSSIVANYLINALGLVQIGIMDSPFFPTVALVRDGKPMNPVRIYAGSKANPDGVDSDQLVVFISEFQPPPNLIKGIASAVLDWAQDQKCTQLVCPEGLIVDKEGGGKRDVEVITLLSEAHPDYPDARAAARVIETIDKLLHRTELDAKPLYEEAERIEMQLKSIHQQTEGLKKPPVKERPSMYG